MSPIEDIHCTQQNCVCSIRRDDPQKKKWLYYIGIGWRCPYHFIYALAA